MGVRKMAWLFEIIDCFYHKDTCVTTTTMFSKNTEEVYMCNHTGMYTHHMQAQVSPLR